MTPETKAVVIDAFCDCDRCVERTTEMYDIAGRCLNCGAQYTVRSRWGDKPPISIECPACGVYEYSWRASLRKPVTP